MDSLPLAISVHHFVSTVGADAGFAAFIAVAILVLLYFAHARETATLRARADESALEVQDLEAQVAQLTDQVAVLPPEISVRAASPRAAAAYGGVPGHATAGVPATARAGAGALLPAAPAGMAAPALAAATRLIPDPESFVHEPAPAPGAGGANGAGHRPVAAPAVAAATIQRPASARAGATDGAARTGVPGQGGPPGPGGQGRAPAPDRPPGGGQQRPGGPPRSQGARMRPPARRSVGRIVLGAAVAVLALAAVAAAVVVLTNRGGSSSASKSSAAAVLARERARHANVIAVRPSTVTVSVLNGTDRVGLAGDVARRLTADGYRKGAVTNFSDQTQTNSVVAYMTVADRPDALAVASSLKLSRSAVQLIDANTKAIACPPSQTCTSQVVVTIGHNLAQ